MSLERPSLGSMDSQWIEVRSVVHSAVAENGTLLLELGSDGTSLRVIVLNYSPPIPKRIEESVVLKR